MNVLSPFDEVVRDLSLAQHLPRIKKLLVYACTYHWENDTARLSSYHLHELVQQLLHLAPSLQELRIYLNNVIHTLNKPAEYAIVSNTIVRHLRHLYPEAIAPVPKKYQSLYKLAADQLTQDTEHIRIKKLLYFVCRGQWTQDINNINLPDLVSETHSLTPTQSDLKAILESIVQNISKPEKYQAIAQRIIKGLAPLYATTPHAIVTPSLPTKLVTPTTTITPNPSPPPHFQLLQPSQLDEHTSPIASPQRLPLQSSPPSLDPESSSPSSPTLIKPSKGISMRKKVASLSTDDLFSLRIEIHKFTNPLLAKYVLLMNNHTEAISSECNREPGQWNSMTWEALRKTDLDTLLRDGLKFCHNPDEFEQNLKYTTHSLHASQQYQTVVSAIVRAVRLIFADGQESVSISHQRPTTLPAETPARKKQREQERAQDYLVSQPLHPLSPQSQRHNQDPTLIEVQKNIPQKTRSLPSHKKADLESTEADSKVDTTEAESTINNLNNKEELGQPLKSSPLAEEDMKCLIKQDQTLDAKRDTALLSNNPSQ